MFDQTTHTSRSSSSKNSEGRLGFGGFYEGGAGFFLPRGVINKLLSPGPVMNMRYVVTVTFKNSLIKAYMILPLPTMGGGRAGYIRMHAR
jgi:hypothetical protein